MTSSHITGRVANLTGQAAEEVVSRLYGRNGYTETERRWRGAGGEIDLILARDDQTIFVEVKKARDFARAAERLADGRQLHRIFASASDYLSRLPQGDLSEARVDVALVDETGRVEIVENVTLH